MDVIKEILGWVLNVVIIPGIPLFLTGGIGILAYLFKAERDKRIALEHQVLDKRRELYIGYLQLWLKISREQRAGKSKVTKDNANRMQEISHKMMFFASDEVIRCFNFNVKKAMKLDLTAEEKVMHQARLFKEMRRDLGYPNTKLSDKEIIQLILKEDVDEILK